MKKAMILVVNLMINFHNNFLQVNAPVYVMNYMDVYMYVVVIATLVLANTSGFIIYVDPDLEMCRHAH